MTADQPAGFLRLFIAIAVPADVRKEIGRAQGQLRCNSPPGAIRWTRPDQFHVTLKFLGDVPVTQVTPLAEALAEACAGFKVLRLSAHGIGYFPHAQTPRVIWARVDDARGQLAELHQQLNGAMRPFAPAQARPEKFAGHITLGRFKPGRHAAIPDLLERAAALHDRRFGDWQAGEVEIVRSELLSTGVLHTSLGSCRLVD